MAEQEEKKAKKKKKQKKKKTSQKSGNHSLFFKRTFFVRTLRRGLTKVVDRVFLSAWSL